MTRFDSKRGEKVPDKHSDNAQRRTRAADVGPPSVKKVSDLYAKGKETVSKKDWMREEHQENQMPEDAHDNGRGRYDNDVPLKGDRSWLRGGGEGHRPNLDTGRFDISNKPQKPTGRKNTASGQDIKASPFSAAHRTYEEK